MENRWHLRFLDLAWLVSTWSKDPSTKVGAVIINNEVERRPISFGYNGIPRGCVDDPTRFEKPQKYLYTEHAERNAIYNARTSLEGAVIYVTHTPCADCARALIQCGIKTVIAFDTPMSLTWTDSIAAAHTMFDEAGIVFKSIPKE